MLTFSLTDRVSLYLQVKICRCNASWCGGIAFLTYSNPEVDRIHGSYEEETLVNSKIMLCLLQDGSELVKACFYSTPTFRLRTLGTELDQRAVTSDSSRPQAGAPKREHLSFCPYKG